MKQKQLPKPVSLTNTTLKGPIYIYLCVCVCVRQFNDIISSQTYELMSAATNGITTRVVGQGNVRKKDVFYTESTEKEQSLWARETASVSTWNVIAGPLATFTSKHPSSNSTRTILSTGTREGG